LLPLSRKQRQELEEATALYQTGVGLAVEYLRGRGIDQNSTGNARLGFVHEPYSGHERFKGRLSIPGIGPKGVYSLRFRLLGDGKPKYEGMPGVPSRLYNIRALHRKGLTVCITEGELDALILEQCGLDAVGVCGAHSWKAHHPRMFADFEEVLVFGDGDDAGQEFVKSVVGSLRNARAVSMPEGMDVNDMYLRDGKAGILEMTGAVS